jgi:hypothetical protein
MQVLVQEQEILIPEEDLGLDRSLESLASGTIQHCKALWRRKEKQVKKRI